MSACRLNFTAHIHIPYYIIHGHWTRTAPKVPKDLAFDRLPIEGCQNLMFISSFWTITTKISRIKALLRLFEICLVPIQLAYLQITFLYQENASMPLWSWWKDHFKSTLNRIAEGASGYSSRNVVFILKVDSAVGNRRPRRRSQNYNWGGKIQNVEQKKCNHTLDSPDNRSHDLRTKSKDQALPRSNWSEGRAAEQPRERGDSRMMMAAPFKKKEKPLYFYFIVITR